MLETDAATCWQCGAVLGQLAAGDDTGGAPTLPVVGLDGEPPTRRGYSMIGREIIGQYVIVDKLGEGGMGEVYLADQPAIGRQVAIKIVHAQTRERDHDELVERFRNEAKAAASLESPHIVQIFNWGEVEDGTLFMAMEYLSGHTLAEVLRQHGPLAPERAVAIAKQICVALSEAHAAGIVHRDLKPSNIMLIERGEQAEFAKVLDFGVAKLEGSDITRSGAMFGTPQYMSPEQLRADVIDGRSDLYSLGVMLYEMLVGQLPFSSPSAVGFITAHLYEKPPALSREVPPALAELVHVLLAKDANERPPDAATVAAELDAALTGRSRVGRRRARRRLLRSAVGMAVLVSGIAALTGGGWLLWRWRVEIDDAHKAELAAAQQRALELEQRVAEQDAAIAQIRADASATADVQMESSERVAEQMRAVQADKQPTTLDAQTRAMLTRSRTELEAELRSVVEQRRIPPSAVAKLWRGHADLVAAFEAGELDEDTLRERLASTIEVYRKHFEHQAAGDNAPLDALEREFLTMVTRDGLADDERRARIAAIHETYDSKQLPDIDRVYFKQLALAKLIREQLIDSKLPSGELPSGELPSELPRAELPEPKPPPPPGGVTPPKPPPKPDGGPAPLPSAEDPERPSGDEPLPSL